MPSPKADLLGAFETHSPDDIRATLATGINIHEPLEGDKTPLTCMIEMYLRSPRFSECVQVLLDAGAKIDDPLLIAVLLDDPDRLKSELRKSQDGVKHLVDLSCTFTPLRKATLLHVAAEYGLFHSAKTLIEAGADVNAKAGLDEHGFNGHTSIFHTVCQHRNHCQPILKMLLEFGAKADIRTNGITWGEGFPWKTIVFDATPISYAQAGLLRQFQRSETDVYENIRLIAAALGRKLPVDLNVPNQYLAN